MSVMRPTLPRSVSRSKQLNVHPANAKKSSIALKVFQNHPFFICMYTTRSQLERVGGCVRTMLGPLYCLYETHPGAHAHRLCLRRRSGGRYAVVDSTQIGIDWNGDCTAST
jgi:hypothetical protein